MKLTSLNSLLDRQGLALFVYGFSGSGKTACCRNLVPSETAFITCEPWGLRTLERFGWKEIWAIVPTDTISFEGAIKRAIAEGAKNLVIDTISRYYDLAELMHEKTSGVGREVGGKVVFDRMGYCKALTERLLDVCLVGVQRGVNVIFLCHEKDVAKEEHVIGLNGQLPENFCRCMDLVLHTRKVEVEGKKVVYELELLFGNSYGKDLFGLQWPRENDIAQVIAECRKRMAPPSHPSADSGPVQETPSAPVITQSIHPPVSATFPVKAPPTPPFPVPVPTPRRTRSAPEEKMVKINGGLAGDGQDEDDKPDPRANLPFSDGEVKMVDEYNKLVTEACANGKTQGFVDQLLEIHAGKRMHPWPAHIIAAVKQVIGLMAPNEAPTRRRRKPKLQEMPASAELIDNPNLPPQSDVTKDGEIPF